MKVGLSLFLFLLIDVHANKMGYFNHRYMSGNLAIDMRNIFEEFNELKNIHKNISTLERNSMNEMSIFSVFNDIISDKDSINIPNITTSCMQVGIKLLLPIIQIPDLKERIIKLLSSPVGKILDAWCKIPERILLGNMQFTGAYDECSKLPDAKYCSTVFQPSTVNLPVEMRYGSCFPKECTSDDVAKVMGILNQYTKGFITFDNSSTGTLCEKPTEYSTGVVLTLSIIFALVGLCLLGTISEICISWSASKHTYLKKEPSEELWANKGAENEGMDSNTPCSDIHQISGKNEKMVIPPTTLAGVENDVSLRPTSSIVVIEPVESNGVVNVLTCFSLQKNTRALLCTTVDDGAITSINGIRVISLTWVILGHLFAVPMLTGSADNLHNMVQIVHRFTFLVISNAYVAVDTFFLLSGLLVGYLTLRRITNNGMGCSDVLMLYVHRVIRLTPSLGLTILFYTNIFPIITSGPNGIILSQTDTFTKPCYDHWWSTLFYFNNFYPASMDNMCLGWSWYLSNDFQFYLIAPAILLMMVFVEKLCRTHRNAVFFNFLLILWFCFSSIVITGVIVGVYDLPGLPTSSLALPNNPKSNQTTNSFDYVYTKPYCRITPFLIGLYLGYLFSRNITLKSRVRDVLPVVGWICAAVGALLVIYGPWKVFKPHGVFFNDGENITYAALHRFAWSCCIAWVIYACHYKFGGLVNDVLSWSAWIPLSRLTYGTYLLHFIVIQFYLLIKDEPHHYQDTTVIFDFLSIAIVSYTCSFILAMLVEYPVFNLEKKLFKR